MEDINAKLAIKHLLAEHSIVSAYSYSWRRSRQNLVRERRPSRWITSFYPTLNEWVSGSLSFSSLSLWPWVDFSLIKSMIRKSQGYLNVLKEANQNGLLSLIIFSSGIAWLLFVNIKKQLFTTDRLLGTIQRSDYTLPLINQ